MSQAIVGRTFKGLLVPSDDSFSSATVPFSVYRSDNTLLVSGNAAQSQAGYIASFTPTAEDLYQIVLDLGPRGLVKSSIRAVADDIAAVKNKTDELSFTQDGSIKSNVNRVKGYQVVGTGQPGDDLDVDLQDQE